MLRRLFLFSITIFSILLFSGCAASSANNPNTSSQPVIVDTSSTQTVFINLDNLTIYNSKLKRKLENELFERDYTIVDTHDQSDMIIDLTIQSCKQYNINKNDSSLLDTISANTSINAGSSGVSAGISIGAGLRTLSKLFTPKTKSVWKMQVHTIINGHETILTAKTQQNSKSLAQTISILEEDITAQILATF